MDNHGQLSAEYIMIIGFLLMVSCTVAVFILEDSELTHIMGAARSGSSEGLIADSLAIYSNETFKDYKKEHPRLISPSRVKIINITYKDMGYDSIYNRTHIQLHIYASGSSMNASDRNCLGDRINYNARKSICIVFNTQNLTNSFYNPAFTNKYVITTADVKWSN